MGGISLYNNSSRDKVKRLTQLAQITEQLRKSKKTIGLITGCFDIIHISHINLFRMAKKHVNFLVIGLENDKTIRNSKGGSRPIHNLEQRLEVLSELISIDYVFSINKVLNFNDALGEAERTYYEISQKLKPDYLITNPLADPYWPEKENRAKRIGAKLIKIRQKRQSSTTSIIQKLEAES
jgi:D-glycero-beta-D-manno-heptose 1-phosphate adenylyltransferase